MLQLSTRARYGLRAMIELSQAAPGKPVLVGQIATQQELPLKYLQAILVALKAAGLVRSVRGPAGGYLLARAPSAICAREVLEALEGKLSVNPCVRAAGVCGRSRRCAARALWKELDAAMLGVLDRFTLEDLTRRPVREGANP
jgi:Rrf2 family cysteine metabolism transcriptional repressor